jgi:multicomponent Na+:H+ antiporter subunit G
MDTFENFVKFADQYAVAALVVIGVFLNCVAAIGLIRLPDVYTRMQASTKGGTLGVGCIILACAIQFQSLLTASQAVLVILFMFLTAPVAGHLIGRAAYFVGVPKWDHTRFDELEGCYDPDTHALSAKPDAENAAFTQAIRERREAAVHQGASADD